MAIRPTGARLYFPTLNINLIADSCEYTYDVEFFDRNEFEHNRLRNAPNSDGSKAIYVDLYSGQVVQWLSTCGSFNTSRLVTPDDSDLDNIKNRWDIRRYKLSGGVSLDSSANILFSKSKDHQILIDRFQAHIAQSGLDISYQLLVTMQSETFSYLTTTGLSMYGDPLTPNGTMLASALAAATSISTSAATGLIAGQSLILNPGGVNQEIVTSSAIAGTLVTVGPLAFAHASGELVQLYETNMLIADYSPMVDRVIKTANGGFTVRKTWQLIIENRVLRPARSTT